MYHTFGMTLLRRVWEWWKPIASKIGDFQARGILVLFYFVLLAPFALAVRLFTDPLSIGHGALRGWRVRETPKARTRSEPQSSSRESFMNILGISCYFHDAA